MLTEYAFRIQYNYPHYAEQFENIFAFNEEEAEAVLKQRFQHLPEHQRPSILIQPN